MPRSVGVAITARAKRCTSEKVSDPLSLGLEREARASRCLRFLASLLPLRKGPWIDANPRGGLVITARPTKEPLSFHHLTPPDFRLKPLAVIFLKAEREPHGAPPTPRPPRTTRRQSRRCRQVHRPPHPARQGPLRPKCQQTRLHRFHLRRRPPRRSPGGITKRTHYRGRTRTK